VAIFSKNKSLVLENDIYNTKRPKFRVQENSWLLAEGVLSLRAADRGRFSGAGAFFLFAPPTPFHPLFDFI
jgi:hypothetical protein